MIQKKKKNEGHGVPWLKKVWKQLPLYSHQYGRHSPADALFSQVLDDFNLTIKPGQTVALVGSSGAGKSTIVGLLLRFYDPAAGRVRNPFRPSRRGARVIVYTYRPNGFFSFQIYLDSIALPRLNVRWLREQIGVVSQEPILFGVSIADNIRYGRENVTPEELLEAAIQASAHDFIKELPNVMRF